MKYKTITGNWIFSQPTIVEGHLNVSGSLDGTDPNDYFWLDSQYRYVQGRKEFTNGVFMKTLKVDIDFYILVVI